MQYHCPEAWLKWSKHEALLARRRQEIVARTATSTGKAAMAETADTKALVEQYSTFKTDAEADFLFRIAARQST